MGMNPAIAPAVNMATDRPRTGPLFEEENVMSLQETPKPPPAPKPRPNTRVDLGGRYRKIGISAVAAAVRFQAKSDDTSGPAADKPAKPQKIYDRD